MYLIFQQSSLLYICDYLAIWWSYLFIIFFYATVFIYFIKIENFIWQISYA